MRFIDAVAKHRRWIAGAGICVAAGYFQGCRTTVDSLGNNVDGAVPTLHPLTGPATYPNAFRDVLGKSDADITTKINAAFNQLFHGDPSTQAIFFPTNTDEAYVKDILHGEIRTEGIGYGMIITVELDKPTEFNQLWNYAKRHLMVQSGPNRGYFSSYCDSAVDGSSPPVPCLDPFGLQQMAMALVFAHDRWGSSSNDADASGINYEADALRLFDVMRNRDFENGGVFGSENSTFDVSTHLVHNTPDTSVNFTRPAAEMPAYYELWEQATGDPFWKRAAVSARAYWKRVANPATGLMPVRADFSGNPVPGWDSFRPEGYRTQLNMVLDAIWIGTDPWEVTEANQLLQFFYSQNINLYGMSYTLSGAVIDTTRETGLIAANGMSALIATLSTRAEFMTAIWNQPIPSDSNRYYAGLLDLLSLLVLSGQYRVY